MDEDRHTFVSTTIVGIPLPKKALASRLKKTGFKILTIKNKSTTMKAIYCGKEDFIRNDGIVHVRNPFCGEQKNEPLGQVPSKRCQGKLTQRAQVFGERGTRVRSGLLDDFLHIGSQSRFMVRICHETKRLYGVEKLWGLFLQDNEVIGGFSTLSVIWI
ncbi:hypothetical protein BGZ49_002688 [Haplosporangium sp. Z 27]|nr:hypothetical protein BGZ49_002688 [Haplosporangium sp. Z 27]